MAIKKELRERVFLAKVLPDKDPKHQGRYRVHIPELMQNMDRSQGIWVKNHSHSGRVTASERGVYGSYIPLQAGTQVKVRFQEDDLNAGAIEQIASDHEVESLPLNSTDRDDIYQILRTPGGSMIQINENTNDVAPNSFNIHHKGYQTTIIIDDAGVHIHTEHNHDLDVDKDMDRRVRGNRRSLIQGDDDRTLEGNYNEEIQGTKKEKIGNDAEVTHESNLIHNTKGDRSEKVQGSYTIHVDSSGMTITSLGPLTIDSKSILQLQGLAGINLYSAGAIQFQGSSVISTPAVLTGASVTPITPATFTEPSETPPTEVIIAERRATNEPSKGADTQDPEEVKRLEKELEVIEEDYSAFQSATNITVVGRAEYNRRQQSFIDAINRAQERLDKAKASTSQTKFYKDAGPSNSGAPSQAGSDPNEYPYFGGKK